MNTPTASGTIYFMARKNSLTMTAADRTRRKERAAELEAARLRWLRGIKLRDDAITGGRRLRVPGRPAGDLALVVDNTRPATPSV